VFIAGRPGATEASLRAAGIDGFIYVGCDVVATLAALLETLS
jgi:methylmalonyl-CoA mutase